jgi:hypothetical protein
VQLGALVMVLNCPVEQAAQVRSATVVACVATKLPGWQTVYAVQAAAVLLATEYVFAGQAEHTGTVVVVGWVDAY